MRRKGDVGVTLVLPNAKGLAASPLKRWDAEPATAGTRLDQERARELAGRRLPFSSRRDTTRVSSTLFIAKALDVIDAKTGLGMEGVARAKFRLVEALVRVIAKHRDAREAKAFERALFAQSALEYETNSAIGLVFDESRYAYNQPYKGGTDFKKHLFASSAIWSPPVRNTNARSTLNARMP